MELVREAAQEIAVNFETLTTILRQLPELERRKVFSPDTFGPISSLLKLGNGYEAAFPGPQFMSMDDILDAVESYTDFDEDDLTKDEDLSEMSE